MGANAPTACRSAGFKNEKLKYMNKDLKQESGVKSEISPADGKPPVVCRYYHPCVGYGDFVREYRGLYGLGLVIRLDDGREWFAPINEFTGVR